MLPMSHLDPGDYEAVILNGEQLESLTDDAWNTILRKKQVVFARTSPQQKLMIVEKFQHIGHIVAVTGDVRTLYNLHIRALMIHLR